MIVQNDTDVACLKVVTALLFLNFLCTTVNARKEENSGENEEEKEGEKLIRTAGTQLLYIKYLVSILLTIIRKTGVFLRDPSYSRTRAVPQTAAEIYSFPCYRQSINDLRYCSARLRVVV